ncbi:MAG: extracellular solute-binding protein [Christensenellales bacterium]|jgi:putative aldouronate transport system substrate-binding protein
MKKLAMLLALALILSCATGIVPSAVAEETVTFTWMYPLGQGFQVVDSMAQNATIIRANAANNVEIEFIHPPVGQETEQYNLMLAGDELPDIITHGWGLPETYPGGADQAILDEYFLDLTQLIKDNAPNYQGILDTNEVVRKAVTTDGGAVWNMCMVDLTPQPVWDGPVVRQDMLDRYGLETPETIDEWYEVLTVLKEKAPADYPDFIVPLWMVSLTHSFNQFMGAYNVDNTFQLNEEGEVVFGPVLDGFKEYLMTMNKWYTEGLFQEDFTASGWSFEEPFLNDKCAALTDCGFWNFDYYTAAATNPDFVMMGTKYPSLVKGEISHISYTATQARGYATVVTTDCENPEKAVSYLDWFYSPEGSLLANWGIEGEDYTVQEDGTFLYTDKIVHNEEGVAIATINFKYLYSHGAFLRDWERENGSYGQEANDCQKRWGDSADDALMMPVTLSYTDEESGEFTSIMNDINTYVAENVVAFVTGERSFDEWDAYVAQIEQMKIARATEIQTAAYTRWQAR